MTKITLLSFSLRLLGFVLIAAAASFATPTQLRAAEEIECDLLIVGGGESGTAAAIQAARFGVPRIVLTNDCNWLGGQFTAEGLAAIDEWTKYRGGRVHFPRSGIFLEIMDLIEADMQRKYGNARPGNCFCAWTTCEPRDTELLFRRLIAPYLVGAGGSITLLENIEPLGVRLAGKRVEAVAFGNVADRNSETQESTFVIKPRITIDASDWGDIVRLSGAKYFCGPDLKDRFQEPSAPESYDRIEHNEINPLTYCMVLRESAQPTIIERPTGYDERRYFAATTSTAAEFAQLGWPQEAMKPFAQAWRDTALPNGPYTDGPTVYHHRRLVDRRHLGLPAGSEAVLVNWPLQDYPTNRYPQPVVDALERLTVGASQKNVVEMNPRERQVVFNDVKQHTLGLLYHLQTTVAERDLAAAGADPNRKIVTFRDLQLTDEFGTPDHLPPKPYIREGLRTQAMYMLREQDVRDTDGNQCWSKSMVPDGAFGFQFNIDFHPTKRIFLNDDTNATWTLVHTPLRNWSTDTDRAMLPLRSMAPLETEGLIVAGKNLGLSSIVQSAVRLHGHGMLAGQAAAAFSVVALREKLNPQQVATNLRLVRLIQGLLLNPVDVMALRRTPKAPRPPGVLIWPYHDLKPSDPHFAAANRAALLGIYVADQQSPDFDAERNVKRREVAAAIRRLEWLKGSTTHTPLELNNPEADADFSLLINFKLAKLPEGAEAVRGLEQPVKRRDFVTILDYQYQGQLPEGEAFSLTGDTDGDGLLDLDDALPFDKDNDNVPDRLDH
ncbi:MAG: FAD-dependent oxidoreductase [Planctomycetia bacterium]|nr:FAD-dependent oxidoreductase [Planctomycetia bacterium]